MGRTSRFPSFLSGYKPQWGGSGWTSQTFADTFKPVPRLSIEGIKWNFTKFLVGSDGTVLRRYAPSDKPEAIEADLATRL